MGTPIILGVPFLSCHQHNIFDAIDVMLCKFSQRVNPQ